MLQQTEKLINSIFSTDLKGMVITVIGAAGVGKTAFSCMQLPVYLYLKEKQREGKEVEKKIVIMNTDNSFLIQRFTQVLEEFGVKYDSVAKNIDVQFLNSFYYQDSAIIRVMKEVHEEQKPAPLFLAVDPFNHHLRMEFAKAKEDYRLHTVGRLSPRLEYQIALLSNLARAKQTTVVLTLLPKKKFTEYVPTRWHGGFFGPTEIAHLSDIVLWLSPAQQEKNKVEIHVMKHRLKPAGEVFTVKLTKGGYIL